MGAAAQGGGNQRGSSISLTVGEAKTQEAVGVVVSEPLEDGLGDVVHVFHLQDKGALERSHVLRSRSVSGGVGGVREGRWRDGTMRGPSHPVCILTFRSGSCRVLHSITSVCSNSSRKCLACSVVSHESKPGYVALSCSNFIAVHSCLTPWSSSLSASLASTASSALPALILLFDPRRLQEAEAPRWSSLKVRPGI